ncbi:DUF2255 family protein [Cryptosporangium sp. NPDC051539]|uniref:DUF2255 family protein n=1 Tax=Cryptosporangium sp. NPDC051539 TaxID=3363962 RepID=UPI00379AA98D
MQTWSAEALGLIGRAQELEIAVRERWVPIWAVSTGGQVFVRTWYRRATGWYGGAVAAGRARVRVPGLVSDVLVDEVGELLRAEVDNAYAAKYGHYGPGSVDRMVGDAAAETTLRLNPVRGDGRETGATTGGVS